MREHISYTRPARGRGFRARGFSSYRGRRPWIYRGGGSNYRSARHARSRSRSKSRDRNRSRRRESKRRRSDSRDRGRDHSPRRSRDRSRNHSRGRSYSRSKSRSRSHSRRRYSKSHSRSRSWSSDRSRSESGSRSSHYTSHSPRRDHDKEQESYRRSKTEDAPHESEQITQNNEDRLDDRSTQMVRASSPTLKSQERRTSWDGKIDSSSNMNQNNDEANPLLIAPPPPSRWEMDHSPDMREQLSYGSYSTPVPSPLTLVHSPQVQQAMVSTEHVPKKSNSKEKKKSKLLDVPPELEFQEEASASPVDLQKKSLVITFSNDHFKSDSPLPPTSKPALDGRLGPHPSGSHKNDKEGFRPKEQDEYQPEHHSADYDRQIPEESNFTGSAAYQAPSMDQSIPGFGTQESRHEGEFWGPETSEHQQEQYSSSYHHGDGQVAQESFEMTSQEKAQEISKTGRPKGSSKEELQRQIKELEKALEAKRQAKKKGRDSGKDKNRNSSEDRGRNRESKRGRNREYSKGEAAKSRTDEELYSENMDDEPDESYQASMSLVDDIMMTVRAIREGEKKNEVSPEIESHSLHSSLTSSDVNWRESEAVSQTNTMSSHHLGGNLEQSSATNTQAGNGNQSSALQLLQSLGLSQSSIMSAVVGGMSTNIPDHIQTAQEPEDPYFQSQSKDVSQPQGEVGRFSFFSYQEGQALPGLDLDINPSHPSEVTFNNVDEEDEFLYGNDSIEDQPNVAQNAPDPETTLPIQNEYVPEVKTPPAPPAPPAKPEESGENQLNRILSAIGFDFDMAERIVSQTKKKEEQQKKELDLHKVTKKNKKQKQDGEATKVKKKKKTNTEEDTSPKVPKEEEREEVPQTAEEKEKTDENAPKPIPSLVRRTQPTFIEPANFPVVGSSEKSGEFQQTFDGNSGQTSSGQSYSGFAPQSQGNVSGTEWGDQYYITHNSHPINYSQPPPAFPPSAPVLYPEPSASNTQYTQAYDGYPQNYMPQLQAQPPVTYPQGEPAYWGGVQPQASEGQVSRVDSALKVDDQRGNEIQYKSLSPRQSPRRRSPDRRRRNSRGRSHDDSNDRRSREKGSRERGSRERGSRERGSRERGSRERGSRERGSRERGSRERGSCERGSRERGSPERGSPERGSRERGSREREVSSEHFYDRISEGQYSDDRYSEGRRSVSRSPSAKGSRKRIPKEKRTKERGKKKHKRKVEDSQEPSRKSQKKNKSGPTSIKISLSTGKDKDDGERRIVLVPSSEGDNEAHMSSASYRKDREQSLEIVKTGRRPYNEQDSEESQFQREENLRKKQEENLIMRMERKKKEMEIEIEREKQRKREEINELEDDWLRKEAELKKREAIIRRVEDKLNKEEESRHEKEERFEKECQKKLKKDKEEYRRRMHFLERELSRLKRQQGDLMRKKQKEKDGHKDPELEENNEQQEEIKGQIKGLKFAYAEAYGKPLPEESPPRKSERDSNRASSKERFSRQEERERERPERDRASPESKSRFSFVYFDSGDNWCKVCNKWLKNINEFFIHLHSKNHMKRCDPHDRPWKTANPTPTSKPLPSAIQAPFKGSELIIPANAFYCRLCKVFSGDVGCASEHIKSRSHNLKYQKFIEENPFYERQLEVDKAAVATAPTKDSSPEPEDAKTQKSPRIKQDSQSDPADRIGIEKGETAKEVKSEPLKESKEEAKKRLEQRIGKRPGFGKFSYDKDKVKAAISTFKQKEEDSRQEEEPPKKEDTEGEVTATTPDEKKDNSKFKFKLLTGKRFVPSALLKTGVAQPSTTVSTPTADETASISVTSAPAAPIASTSPTTTTARNFPVIGKRIRTKFQVKKTEQELPKEMVHEPITSSLDLFLQLGEKGGKSVPVFIEPEKPKEVPKKAITPKESDIALAFQGGSTKEERKQEEGTGDEDEDDSETQNASISSNVTEEGKTDEEIKKSPRGRGVFEVIASTILETNEVKKPAGICEVIAKTLFGDSKVAGHEVKPPPPPPENKPKPPPPPAYTSSQAVPYVQPTSSVQTTAHSAAGYHPFHPLRASLSSQVFQPPVYPHAPLANPNQMSYHPYSQTMPSMMVPPPMMPHAPMMPTTSVMPPAFVRPPMVRPPTAVMPPTSTIPETSVAGTIKPRPKGILGDKPGEGSLATSTASGLYDIFFSGSVSDGDSKEGGDSGEASDDTKQCLAEYGEVLPEDEEPSEGRGSSDEGAVENDYHAYWY